MRASELQLIRLPKFRRMLLSRIDMRLRSSLPVPVRRALAAGEAHECPICRSAVAGFRNFGNDLHEWCPVCLSMKRHRLVWLHFERNTDLFDGTVKRMLHVAPEPAIEAKLKVAPNLEYITADLLASGVMVRMDITQIQYPDDFFDVVYCSHVLEHVPDDRRAMREFHRVLRPSGWAVFMVPLTAETTIEDPDCRDPSERERRFGQHDHVRRYGPDFVDRLITAGFSVDVLRPSDLSSEQEQCRYGLPDRERVYFCHKSRSS